jgi:hypothetical protein
MEMDGQDLEFQQLGISVDPDPHFRACPLGVVMIAPKT